MLRALLFVFVILILFSEQTWAEPNNPPLSPPELIPASDRDPEHLSMFVTHFFRWWVDNQLQYAHTSPDTKERKHFLNNEAETIKNSITPTLRYHYEQNLRGVEETDPVFPLNDFEDNWRNTASSRIVTLKDHTATVIVSFPRQELHYDPPSDTPFQLKIFLKIYQRFWRIQEVENITNKN